ncbi:MAG: ribonuclease III [Thiotrichales bacterium]
MPKKSQKLFSLLEPEVLNSELFQKAITHRSASKKNNERLEFLGDSVLSVVMTEYLFNKLPSASEGELSRLRSHLVKGDMLARIASDNNLGEYVKLGAGELKSGGFRRDSILEDAFEAIIGAVFYLKGFEYTRHYLLELFDEKLQDLPDPELLKDAKSRLQEWLQSRSYPVPIYTVLDISGEAHNQTFTAQCEVEGLDITTQAKGSSRRKAEQRAAKKALDLLLLPASI